LERVNIDSLHQRNLHYLAAEVFKWLHQIGPSLHGQILKSNQKLLQP